jgi:hypothetical protein
MKSLLIYSACAVGEEMKVIGIITPVGRRSVMSFRFSLCSCFEAFNISLLPFVVAVKPDDWFLYIGSSFC